jgi:hypothetical protein
MSKVKNPNIEHIDPKTGEVTNFPKIRTAHSPRIRMRKKFSKPSMTKQEFKDECDVNKVVDHYMKTGHLNAYDESKALYLDFTKLPSSNYQETLNMIAAASAAFDALPASARERHNNDVGKFLEAVSLDPDSVFIDPVRVARNVPVIPATPVAPPPPEATGASNMAKPDAGQATS